MVQLPALITVAPLLKHQDFSSKHRLASKKLRHCPVSLSICSESQVQICHNYTQMQITLNTKLFTSLNMSLKGWQVPDIPVRSKIPPSQFSRIDGRDHDAHHWWGMTEAAGRRQSWGTGLPRSSRASRGAGLVPAAPCWSSTLTPPGVTPSSWQSEHAQWSQLLQQPAPSHATAAAQHCCCQRGSQSPCRCTS